MGPAFLAHAQTNQIQNGTFEAADASKNSVRCLFRSSCPPLPSGWGAGWSAKGVVSVTGIIHGSQYSPASLPHTDLLNGNFVAAVGGGMPAELKQQLQLDAGTYDLSWLPASSFQGESFKVTFADETLSVHSQPSSGWHTNHVTFTLDEATTGDLVFSAPRMVYVDDITLIKEAALPQPSIAAAAPEPQTYTLMATCLAVMGFSMRNRL
jgi:hypothetical protein